MEIAPNFFGVRYNVYKKGCSGEGVSNAQVIFLTGVKCVTVERVLLSVWIT
jgi:hypothetical protein